MEIEWLKELRIKIPEFLKLLKYNNKSGLYRYSLSGDYYDDTINWGLGQAVFAAKIYYMFNILTKKDRNELSSFINSFQDESGYIHDPLIERVSRTRRVASSIKNIDFNNIFNEQTMKAETRQSFAALQCLGSRPNLPCPKIPYTKKDISKYIKQLNWRQPWGAASYVSHLLFFLNYNKKHFHAYENETEELINYSIKVANSYQQKDGAWYAPVANIPIHQKVNGAMKMMTAYEAVDRDDFNNPEGLIDLCLSTINDGHACNNFNIICVLYHCSKKTDYRRPEIETYFFERLKLYKNHYWPEYGGFSFYERKANNLYYGAKITKGLPEPDIHGTVLFLWGIALITDLLNLDNIIRLQKPVT